MRVILPLVIVLGLVCGVGYVWWLSPDAEGAAPQEQRGIGGLRARGDERNTSPLNPGAADRALGRERTQPRDPPEPDAQAWLRGRVLRQGAPGSPITGATVFVHRAPAPLAVGFAPAPRPPLAIAHTDPNGRFRMREAPAGLRDEEVLILGVAARGFLIEHSDVRAFPAKGRHREDFSLETGRLLTGIVRKADGTPARGVSLAWVSTTTPPQSAIVESPNAPFAFHAQPGVISRTPATSDAPHAVFVQTNGEGFFASGGFRVDGEYRLVHPTAAYSLTGPVGPGVPTDGASYTLTERYGLSLRIVRATADPLLRSAPLQLTILRRGADGVEHRGELSFESDFLQLAWPAEGPLASEPPFSVEYLVSGAGFLAAGGTEASPKLVPGKSTDTTPLTLLPSDGRRPLPCELDLTHASGGPAKAFEYSLLLTEPDSGVQLPPRRLVPTGVPGRFTTDVPGGPWRAQVLVSDWAQGIEAQTLAGPPGSAAFTLLDGFAQGSETIALEALGRIVVTRPASFDAWEPMRLDFLNGAYKTGLGTMEEQVAFCLRPGVYEMSLSGKSGGAPRRLRRNVRLEDGLLVEWSP